ncbi:helix-turn-helix domain-containing protein [Cellulomonas triticagri]|nr:helix-turn-helix domain-containing protein [Cellulomonas triticagri]
MNAARAEDVAAEALRGLGMPVDQRVDGADAGYDLLLGPGATPVEVAFRALVDEQIASRLVERRRWPGATLLVVADRVTSDARRLLLDRRAGYYDLRGHVALRAEAVFVDADVEPLTGRIARKDPVAGRAGLEIATALLLAPEGGTAVRALARTLDRSPGTVSEVLAALTRDGLVDERRRVIGTGLFWRVAERWSTPPTHLATEPPPGDASRVTGPLRLGLGDVEHEVGWALAGSVAALAYGAPVAIRADQPKELYVPDELVVRRAERLLGVAQPGDAACTVRVAPVPAVCAQRVDLPGAEPVWPLAHPLFVALDLAQDAGRGREILDAWHPPGRWSRAW